MSQAGGMSEHIYHQLLCRSHSHSFSDLSISISSGLSINHQTPFFLSWVFVNCLFLYYCILSIKSLHFLEWEMKKSTSIQTLLITKKKNHHLFSHKSLTPTRAYITHTHECAHAHTHFIQLIWFDRHFQFTPFQFVLTHTGHSISNDCKMQV